MSLDAGLTCPNRDGSKGIGGCAFCSPAGSGDFAGDRRIDVVEQFHHIKTIMHRKWPNALYIGYFQAFTNTYAPAPFLRDLYFSILRQEGVVGLSIATRPDCLPDDVLDLLDEINRTTYLWVELGLQTVNDAIGAAMNRGYDFVEFEMAVKKLRQRKIKVCPHIILGLPGESRKMMMQTARTLAGIDIQGLKIHLLHVMQETPLAKMYEGQEFQLMERGEYISLVADILEILPPDMVIHRLTGDSPRQTLIGPLWSLQKWEVLNDIDRELINRDSYQGKLF